MLGDHGFERSPLAQRSRELCPQRVETVLAFRLLFTFEFEQLTNLSNLLRQRFHTLRDRLEFDGQLSALAAKVFGLSARNRHF